MLQGILVIMLWVLNYRLLYVRYIILLLLFRSVLRFSVGCKTICSELIVVYLLAADSLVLCNRCELKMVRFERTRAFFDRLAPLVCITTETSNHVVLVRPEMGLLGLGWKTRCLSWRRWCFCLNLLVLHGTWMHISYNKSATFGWIGHLTFTDSLVVHLSESLTVRLEPVGRGPTLTVTGLLVVLGVTIHGASRLTLRHKIDTAVEKTWLTYSRCLLKAIWVSIANGSVRLLLVLALVVMVSMCTLACICVA